MFYASHTAIQAIDDCPAIKIAQTAFGFLEPAGKKPDIRRKLLDKERFDNVRSPVAFGGAGDDRRCREAKNLVTRETVFASGTLYSVGGRLFERIRDRRLFIAA